MELAPYPAHIRMDRAKPSTARAVAAARNQGSFERSGVQKLQRALVTAAAHVELFVRDGWLIHLALMSDVRGHFEDLHGLLLDILEDAVPPAYLSDILQVRRAPALASACCAACCCRTGFMLF